jgi:DNA-directed RNA polymerase subunit L
MVNRDKLLEIGEPLRQKIIDFTENELPEEWQAEIPDENLAVDGKGRTYAFSIDDIGFEEYHNIKYYVNRPINEEYFLTIKTDTDDNKTSVDVLLCEGSEVVGFTGSVNRNAECHRIETQALDQVESEEELPEHFDEISKVVKQFADKYRETDLDELQELAS